MVMLPVQEASTNLPVPEIAVWPTMVRPRKSQRDLACLLVNLYHAQFMMTRIKKVSKSTRRSAERPSRRSLPHLLWTALARLVSAPLRNSSASTLHLKRPETSLRRLILLKMQRRPHLHLHRPHHHHHLHLHLRHHHQGYLPHQDSHRRHRRHRLLLHPWEFPASYRPLRLVRRYRLRRLLRRVVTPMRAQTLAPLAPLCFSVRI